MHTNTASIRHLTWFKLLHLIQTSVIPLWSLRGQICLFSCRGKHESQGSELRDRGRLQNRTSGAGRDLLCCWRTLETDGELGTHLLPAAPLRNHPVSVSIHSRFSQIKAAALFMNLPSSCFICSAGTGRYLSLTFPIITYIFIYFYIFCDQFPESSDEKQSTALLEFATLSTIINFWAGSFPKLDVW